jgi:hypothetical protein
MISFLIVFISLVRGDIEFLYISSEGTDRHDCGMMRHPCESFEYIFETRLVDPIYEKGVLVYNDFVLSDNSGQVNLYATTPQYHIYGAYFKEQEFSYIFLPHNCGQFHCEQSVNFEYLIFLSETGDFYGSVTEEKALIYSDVSNVQISIVSCSFTTGTRYDYAVGSNTALLCVHNGATLSLSNVIISRFNVLNRNFIDISGGYPVVSSSFTNVTIAYVIAYDESKVRGIVHLSNATVVFQGCFFNESHGYGPAAFSFEHPLSLFFFFFFYGC